MDRNYLGMSKEEYEHLFRNPLKEFNLLASYLRGPVDPLPHPNVDDFTNSQPEEYEEFVLNT